MSFRFSVIKKNQILTWSLIIVLGVIGYMNYQSDPSNVYAQEVSNMMEQNLGDAVFVDGTNLVADVTDKNYKYSSDEFFSETRIERSNEYAKQIETYEKIILAPDSGNEQKEVATLELKRITNEKNAISVAENLIKLKGFEDGIILMNNGNANVIILDDELDSVKVAQIQNIVQNELEVENEKIHITSFMK